MKRCIILSWATITTRRQGWLKCGVSLQRNLCHFLRLIAHILTFRDKKYRILTFCNKTLWLYFALRSCLQSPCLAHKTLARLAAPLLRYNTLIRSANSLIDTIECRLLYKCAVLPPVGKWTGHQAQITHHVWGGVFEIWAVTCSPVKFWTFEQLLSYYWGTIVLLYCAPSSLASGLAIRHKSPIMCEVECLKFEL